MTREEAAKTLTELWGVDYRYCLGTMGVEAVDMAIEALKEPEQKAGSWIPLKTRPMDEDERKEWSAKLGHKLEDDEAVIYMSPLPDDGQNVLICQRNGNIRMDTFVEDDYGCYFDEYGDMDGVVAWMPLPKPWEGE